MEIWAITKNVSTSDDFSLLGVHRVETERRGAVHPASDDTESQQLVFGVEIVQEGSRHRFPRRIDAASLE